MNNLVQQYVELSCKIGQRVPRWTQGAGGNISFKTEEKLFVKATGTRLDGAKFPQAIAEVDLQQIRNEIDAVSIAPAEKREQLYVQALKNALAKNSPRASMEAGLHALSPMNWVLHFHSLVAGFSS